MPIAYGFTFPVGDRSYILNGGQITEGRPGGFIFPDHGIAPNGERYGYIADDPTNDGWYSASDHGEWVPGLGYHLGEDWNLLGDANDDEGAPVYAVADGVIVRMGDDGIGLYGQAFGNYIVIRHDLPDGSTVYSLYAHLEGISTNIYTTERGDIIGATVEMGQQIGTIGRTGDALTAHLHFEMYHGTISTTETILDERGYSSSARPNGWVDPSDFIEWINGQLGDSDLAQLQAPYSSSLGAVGVNQATYLDPNADTHASGVDAAALDFNVQIGRTVLAMANGRVVAVHDSESSGSGGTHGFGNYVTVRHTVQDADGTEIVFYATYAHLSQESLAQIRNAFDYWAARGFEMPVFAGDTIGVVGNAGYGQYGHLHVQFGTNLIDVGSALDIADASPSPANTRLLQSLTFVGLGGRSLAEIEGAIWNGNQFVRFQESISSTNIATGDIPGYNLRPETGGGGEGVDLTVTSVELSGYAASPGSDLEVTFDIANLGNVESQSVRAQIVLSSEPDFSGRIRILDTISISSLDGYGALGSARSYTETVTLPIDLGRTTYYIGIIVDSDNEIPELDESNNSHVSAGLAVGGGLSGDPDLRVSNLGIQQTVVEPGSDIIVSFRISADSDGAPPYSFRIVYSDDATLGPEDTIVYEQTTSRGLGYFGIHYYDISMRIPDGAESGLGHLFVVADPNNQLEEQREDNNIRSEAFAVSQNVADNNELPDLEADNLIIPGVLVVGEQFRYASEIANISGDDSVPSGRDADGNPTVVAYNTALIFSRDPIISDDDILVHIGSFGTLAPGEFVDASSRYNITLPTDIEPGIYYAALIADYYNGVLEDDEDNNVTSLVIVEVLAPEQNSVQANSDYIHLGSRGAHAFNITGNDFHRGPQSPQVVHILGNSDFLNTEVQLAAGITVSVTDDGSLTVDATGLLEMLAPGQERQFVLPYRILSNDGFYSSAEIVIQISGSTSIVGTPGSDLLIGTVQADSIIGRAGSDLIIGGPAGDVLEGRYGIDTVSYQGSSAGVTVRLQGFSDPSVQTATGGDATGDQISGFENIIGSAYADLLIGSDGVNRIDGAYGDDIIRGGAGADILLGDLGYDTLSYEGSSAGVTVRLQGFSDPSVQSASGGDATGDQISGFEAIIGSAHADTLFGSDGVNRIDGGRGNDIVRGGAGGDILLGGRGRDTISYQGSSASVTVRLQGFADPASQSASGGDATGDQISGFEDILGSSFADTLIGSDGINRIDGGAGDDTIRGGAAADILIGGFGVDTLSYEGSSAGVTVRLQGFSDPSAQSAFGGDATGDQISGFENVIGSAHSDSLYGSDAANRIDGGRGDDTMRGGGNADVFVFSFASGDDVILDWEDGTDRIDVSALGTSWNEISAGLTQSGNDVIIDLGNGHTVTLVDTALDLLDASDFLFAPNSANENPAVEKSEEATTLRQPGMFDFLPGSSSDSAPFMAQQFEMGLCPPVENLA